MKPINEQKFYPFTDGYEVSLEGVVRLTKHTNGGNAGMLLAPTRRTDKVHYLIRDKETKKVSRQYVVSILYTALSVNAPEMTEAQFNELREAVITFNAKFVRAKVKNEQRTYRRDNALDTYHMPCPFLNLRTEITGTYDDPQIDPFGCGHHYASMGNNHKRASLAA